MQNMRAWQFKTTAGGIEKNLYLPAAGVPKPRINQDQVLVEVYSAALSHIDYKVPELGIAARAVIPSPSTPGRDFCGKIAKTGHKVSSRGVGEMVFGTHSGPLGHGSLGQYISVSQDMFATIPEGAKVDDMAGVGVAALTAYQSIHANAKKGDKIFINGGSGGCGVFGIQIAKTLGCHVTTSCSSANVDLCKSLGADEVIDYKSIDLITVLKEKGQVFNLVVDNVGLPSNLYSSCHHFTVAGGKFAQVGTEISVASAVQHARNMILPRFLGGGKRKYQIIIVKTKHEDLNQLANWISEGKIRTVIDSVWGYDDAPRALERLKTVRAKGKVIVHVKESSH